MIDLELLVVFDGEKVDLPESRASDLVAFERQFGVAWGRLRDGLSMEQACFLVYRALLRLGRLAPGTPFDDAFLERIDDLVQRDRPFDQPATAPSGGPSPASPTGRASTPRPSSTRRRTSST